MEHDQVTITSFERLNMDLPALDSFGVGLVCCKQPDNGATKAAKSRSETTVSDFPPGSAAFVGEWFLIG